MSTQKTKTQNEFTPGDCVALKSGGPTMTVNRICTIAGVLTGMLECSWFDGKKLKREQFEPDSLKNVESVK